MYRPRPALDRSVTAPAVIPGLGFHVVPPRQPQPVSPAADLFSPSIYSSSSLPSPSTDSLPSPVSSHSGEEHAEDDARAWSGTPEWDDDDNYNSPVWGSRWARRQDSTVSDSLWGSADGSDSLFGGSLSADGGRKDASRSLDGLAARSLSTDSSAGGQLTDGGGRLFLPAAPRTYTRRSESSVGSLFRFAGPAIAISASSASPVEPDGWEDLSTAISDEVHYDGGGGGGAYGSYQSSLRLSSNHRASYDSAFAFDGPTRRPSNDSFLAPPPAQLPRRAPIHGGSLVPAAPANAGAELLFRRNSAGSFSDYQMRRASFERRTSVGSHPLVTAVDPLFSPELELLPAEQLSAPTAADRRVSTVSELEREDRLAFLMDLQRRVSQVVEVQPGGRQYAIDQWEMDRQAIVSRALPRPSASSRALADRTPLCPLSPAVGLVALDRRLRPEPLPRRPRPRQPAGDALPGPVDGRRRRRALALVQVRDSAQEHLAHVLVRRAPFAVLADGAAAGRRRALCRAPVDRVRHHQPVPGRPPAGP